jgi:hypothetical protein
VASKSRREPLSKRVRKVYELHFCCKIEDQDEVLGLKIDGSHAQGIWQAG